MKKRRINVLARELEMKSHLILDLLPELGVSEKLTHSSSIDEDVADKLRIRFGRKPGGDGQDYAAQEEANGHDAAVAVEEAPEPVVETRPAPPVEEVAEPPAKIETAPEPPVAEPPNRLAPPLRPPVAAHAPALPMRPVGVPARPLPLAPKPGQVLSGPSGQAPTGSAPRQPFPCGLPEGGHAPIIPRPPLVQRNPPSQPEQPRAASPYSSPGVPTVPRPPAAAPRFPSPGTGGLRPPTTTRPGLVGQPTQRPVVPPPPHLVARLSQPKAASPGQPPPPPPGLPPRSSPVPAPPVSKRPIPPRHPL